MSSRPKLRDTKSRMQILVEQKHDGAVAEAKGRGGREGRESGLHTFGSESRERGEGCPPVTTKSFGILGSSVAGETDVPKINGED